MQICVPLTLTNGKGKYDLSLAIENANIGEAIVETPGPLTIRDPLRIVNINVPLRNLVFFSAGKY